MRSSMWIIIAVFCAIKSLVNAWPHETFRPRMAENEVVDITGQLTYVYKIFMIKSSAADGRNLEIYLRGYRRQILLKFGNSRWIYTDADHIAPGKPFRIILRQKANVLKFYLLAVTEKSVVLERSYPLVATEVSLIGPVQNGRITKSQWSNYVRLPADCGRRLATIDVPTNLCERISDQFRTPVANNTLAQAGNHPWQVSMWQSDMGRRGEIFWHHVCGGALIDECWVISAAHCFPQPWATIRLRARVGDFYNWNDRIGDFSSYESSQEFSVKKIIIHEQFRLRSFAVNDIALVQLRTNPNGRCVQYGQYIQPACLPSTENQFVSGKECVIAGWGARRHGRKLIEDQPCLQEARVHLISNQQCKRQYPDIQAWYRGQPPLEVIPRTVQCTASSGSSIAEACRGDSGGPLVCSDSSKSVLWGVASKGKRCDAFYGVHTKMTSFVDFVHRYLLQENKFDPNVKDA